MTLLGIVKAKYSLKANFSEFGVIVLRSKSNVSHVKRVVFIKNLSDQTSFMRKLINLDSIIKRYYIEVKVVFHHLH